MQLQFKPLPSVKVYEALKPIELELFELETNITRTSLLSDRCAGGGFEQQYLQPKSMSKLFFPGHSASVLPWASEFHALFFAAYFDPVLVARTVCLVRIARDFESVVELDSNAFTYGGLEWKRR
jgi:hypothetical protein